MSWVSLIIEQELLCNVMKDMSGSRAPKAKKTSEPLVCAMDPMTFHRSLKKEGRYEVKAKSERSAKGIPSLHGDATIVYGGGTAVLPDIDVAGANRLALVGVEAAGEQGEHVARDGKEDLESIVGGAYARVLEGGLLVIGRGHEGRMVRRGWNGDIGGSRESQTI